MSRYEAQPERFEVASLGLKLEPETQNPKIKTNNLSIDMLSHFI
jgi:hypothetical protein